MSDTAGAAATPVTGSGARRRTGSPGLVLALTSVAFFMVSLDALVVVTALPAIHQSIGGAIGTLEWAVNGYGLTFAAGIITAAALGERLGRRRVYVAGLTVFTLASAACAVAPNASLLIAARAVQGLGAAAVTPLALTILAAAFPVERRGAIVGIFGGISGLAVAGGPLVGGAVTQGLDWHWIFWINVPFGVAAALGSTLFLPAGRTAHAATASDTARAASASGAAGASAAGSGRAWLDVPGVVLSAGGGALLAHLAVFIGDEREGELVFRLELVVARDRVARDADDRRLHLGEVGEIVAEGAGLRRAARGVVLWIEIEHNLLALEVLERDLAAAIGRQCETRRLVANLETHAFPS